MGKFLNALADQIWYNLGRDQAIKGGPRASCDGDDPAAVHYNRGYDDGMKEREIRARVMTGNKIRE